MIGLSAIFAQARRQDRKLGEGLLELRVSTDRPGLFPASDLGGVSVARDRTEREDYPKS